MQRIKLSELTNFSPKQKVADTECLKYKYFLYGGAMGGGKSYWLRWKLVKLLFKWAKQGKIGVEVGMFCENYPTLKDRQISKISKEFPLWLGDFHSDHKEHGKCYILKPEYGSGIIKFRNLDDPSKYQSAEFAAIAVDELTKNDYETFEDLRNRLRWSGIDDVRFIAGTNPGGAGHAWVKKYFIDKDFPEEESESNQFGYVQALATDNPHLSETYMAQLESLSPDKRRAFLEGDWDIFKGQYFPEWRKDIHVCEPFTIPTDWKRVIWGDYGYSAPSAVYWVAISPDKKLYVYRELYETNLTYKELTEEIIARTPDNELSLIHYWVFDPAIWQKKGENDQGISGAERMKARWRELMKEKNRVRPLELQPLPQELTIKRGNNERIVGWNMLRDYLQPYLEEDIVTAKLQVFPQCKDVIRTIPALVYDEHRTEDVDTDGEDHSGDAFRYGVMDRPVPHEGRNEVEERRFKLRMRQKKIKSRKARESSYGKY